MFRFHGGQPVEKGTYWNLSTGEKIDAGANTMLPGARDAHYVKLPVFSVFIAGPLAGLLFTCIIPFLFIFVLLTFLPGSVFASSETVSSDEAKGPGMTMTFLDKDTLSVHVDSSHFKNTVHGFVTCTGCHSSVSPQHHPSQQYGPKHEFVLSIAGACKTCHADEQIMANPLHQRAILKANAPPWSDCRGSHAIRKVPTQKETQSTAQYCLTRHKQQLSLSLKGKSLLLSMLLKHYAVLSGIVT